MEISIVLSDEEKKLVEKYAKKYNLSIEEALKKALFEKIKNTTPYNTIK